MRGERGERDKKNKNCFIQNTKYKYKIYKKLK